MIRKYENGESIVFKIDYGKEIVKFTNGTIHGKNVMFLRDFAVSVLGIESEDKEFIAAYIGKEAIDTYKKKRKYYILKQIKTKKNYFEGSIQKIEA